MQICTCCAPPRYLGDLCTVALVRASETEQARDLARNAKRQFDHLDGAPLDEDRHLTRVAQQMRADKAWWFAHVPERSRPLQKTSNNLPAVSREFTARTERARRAAWKLTRLDADEFVVMHELLEERRCNP